LGNRKAVLKVDAAPVLFKRELNKWQSSSSSTAYLRPTKKRTPYDKGERARVSRVLAKF